jgi:quinol monooxygenase YgiN
MSTCGRHVVPIDRLVASNPPRLPPPKQLRPKDLAPIARASGALARFAPIHTGMIIQTLRLVPAPERRREMLELLRSLQGPTLAQPGCCACDVYEELGPERAVVLVERWTTMPTLQSRLRSAAYARVLAAMEMSRSPPDVRFDHVCESEGMAVIEQSRASRDTETSFEQEIPHDDRD